MTENDASVSTFWLKLFLARVAAGVRHEPRVKGGVNLFAAVALVSGGNAFLSVSVTTFWTAPLKYLLLATTLDYNGRNMMNSKTVAEASYRFGSKFQN